MIATMKNNRKRIHPNHTDYTGVIGQIISEFDENGITKKYVTTGTIYVHTHMHVITTASTFIHSYEQNSCLHFEYAKRATIFIARDGGKEYWIKAPLKSFRVHPEYIKHPGLYGGFDISVAMFDLNEAKSFIKELSTFKKMLGKIVPKVPNSPQIKTKDKVFLTGYPGEKSGTMFQIKAEIHDFMVVEDKTHMIVLKDVKTSGGLTGSPILKIDETNTEIVGVYVGFDPTTGMEI